MHDPKFEQEVQRKMHDLEFVPSETVWENIRRDMAPAERRRWIAAIWWWLVPGLLALTAAGVSYWRSGPGSIRTVRPGAAVRGSDAAAGKRIGKKNSRGGNVAWNQGGTGNAFEEGVQGASGNGLEGRLQGRRSFAERRQNGIAAQQGRPGKAATPDANLRQRGIEQTTAVPFLTGVRPSAPVMAYTPGRIVGFGSRSEVGAPFLYARPGNTALSGIPRPERSWRFGFSAGAGSSTLEGVQGSRLVYGTAGYSYYSGSANALVPASNLSITAGSPKRFLADVKPDLSYWAGIFGEKRISGRWSVDIGLNLHYYSARLETNEHINYYAPSSASLFQPTAVSFAANTSSGYANLVVDTYLNRYYFLEVPVAAQWRINPRAHLPLFWRGGAVFSYLMSSDAVYYDTRSGNYYKSNGVARPGQASLQTGIMVALPIKRLDVRAGAEAQYAVTGMLRTGSSGGHLAYGGLRLAVTR